VPPPGLPAVRASVAVHVRVKSFEGDMDNRRRAGAFMIWSKFQGIEIAMLNFNEGKACDAIIRRLEKSADATRTDVRFPEQERHAFPVEVAFKIGEQLVALEHTGIEPFGGHVEMEAKFAKLYKPMEEALKDAFGKAAMYELIIPINAFQGKKMAEVKAIQKPSSIGPG
jgi:hypothetical protein